MSDFFNFKKMITPEIIKIIFGIETFLFLLLGLKIWISGSSIGFVIIILGIVISRVSCEVLIVIFSINESLREISKKTIFNASNSYVGNDVNNSTYHESCATKREYLSPDLKKFKGRIKE